MSAYVCCYASSIDIVIIKATYVVENFKIFLVAALYMVVMVGFAARKVVISGIRASRDSSPVGDAGEEEGREQERRSASEGCLRFEASESLLGFSGSVWRVGVCGFRWARGVRGVRGFRGVRRLCGVRGDLGIRGATGVRGSSGCVGFSGSVGFVGSEWCARLVGSGGVRGEVRGVRGPSRPWSRWIRGVVGSVGFSGILKVRGDCGVWGSGASSGTVG